MRILDTEMNRRGTTRLLYCLAATAMVLPVTTIGFAQVDSEQTPAKATQKEDLAHRDWVSTVMTDLGPRIDHVAERVASRYHLSEAPPLRESV